MRGLLKKLVLLMGLAVCLVGLHATPALAYDPLQSACGADNGAAKSSACSPTITGSDPITGSNGILHKAGTIISLIAGVTAVILAIISGFQFITADGDPQKAAGARTALIGAVIGVLIILVAQSILLFVLKRV